MSRCTTRPTPRCTTRGSRVENPIGSNGDAEVLIPPTGHIAGVWARTDETRGVWKAPANDTIARLPRHRVRRYPERAGVAQPDRHQLHPAVRHSRHPDLGRPHPGFSDTDWRYINVRRLFNMVETTIVDGTQWAVFEPNDVKLWEGMKSTLNAFLARSMAVHGALFGTSADQAFFVKCDAETNPPESIDQGMLVVEVGIAPVKPAEFVIFRISQQKQTAS